MDRGGATHGARKKPLSLLQAWSSPEAPPHAPCCCPPAPSSSRISSCCAPSPGCHTRYLRQVLSLRCFCGCPQVSTVGDVPQRAPAPGSPAREGQISLNPTATCTPSSSSHSAPHRPDLEVSSGKETINWRTPNSCRSQPPPGTPIPPNLPFLGGTSPHPAHSGSFWGSAKVLKAGIGKDAFYITSTHVGWGEMGATWMGTPDTEERADPAAPRSHADSGAPGTAVIYLFQALVHDISLLTKAAAAESPSHTQSLSLESRAWKPEAHLHIHKYLIN